MGRHGPTDVGLELRRRRFALGIDVTVEDAALVAEMVELAGRHRITIVDRGSYWEVRPTRNLHDETMALGRRDPMVLTLYRAYRRVIDQAKFLDDATFERQSFDSRMRALGYRWDSSERRWRKRWSWMLKRVGRVVLAVRRPSSVLVDDLDR